MVCEHILLLHLSKNQFQLNNNKYGKQRFEFSRASRNAQLGMVIYIKSGFILNTSQLNITNLIHLSLRLLSFFSVGAVTFIPHSSLLYFLKSLYSGNFHHNFNLKFLHLDVFHTLKLKLLLRTIVYAQENNNNFVFFDVKQKTPRYIRIDCKL